MVNTRSTHRIWVLAPRAHPLCLGRQQLQCLIKRHVLPTHNTGPEQQYHTLSATPQPTHGHGATSGTHIPDNNTAHSHNTTSTHVASTIDNTNTPHSRSAAVTHNMSDAWWSTAQQQHPAAATQIDVDTHTGVSHPCVLCLCMCGHGYACFLPCVPTHLWSAALWQVHVEVSVHHIGPKAPAVGQDWLPVIWVLTQLQVEGQGRNAADRQ
jgi:hypothetical protein